MASIVDVVHEGIAFGREILRARQDRWRTRYTRAVRAAKEERAKRLAAKIASDARDYIRRNRP
jgi:hypothetical protein